MQLLSDANYPVSERRDALAALGGLGKDVQLRGVQIAVVADEPLLRAAAIQRLADLSPRTAFDPLQAALDGGTPVERQAAIVGLGRLSDARADALILAWLERLTAGGVEPAVQLDLLEAAKTREDPRVKDQLARVEAHLAGLDPVDAFAFALEGGDAAAGEDIFFNKTAVSCARCHGTLPDVKRVGPSLAGIGGKKSRRELLEALLLPNKTIAEGFATVVLQLDSGTIVTGIVVDESNGVIRLVDDQSEEFTVSTDSIEDRYQGQSAMPDDVARHLTRAQIRDLVEFLASLRE
jgi:quinoprotein glucose dehydrogenase